MYSARHRDEHRQAARLGAFGAACSVFGLGAAFRIFGCALVLALTGIAAGLPECDDLGVLSSISA
jgi:hypothetical protein